MAASIWDGPGEPILALVSGLSPANRERWPLLMVQAFIDESASDRRVLVLAGYLAAPPTWAAFSHDWQSILDMAPAWPCAKMNEIWHRFDNPEVRERTQALYRVIETHVMASVCCVVHTDALLSVVAELGLPSFFSNPYWIACRELTVRTAQHLEKMGSANEPIEFIFDERAEKKRIIPIWDGFVGGLPEAIGEIMAPTPTFRDDMKYLPLQAADIYAWWARKWWLEDGHVHGVTLRYPWGAKKNFPRLVMEANGDFLRAEMMKLREQYLALPAKRGERD